MDSSKKLLTRRRQLLAATGSLHYLPGNLHGPGNIKQPTNRSASEQPVRRIWAKHPVLGQAGWRKGYRISRRR